MEKMQLQLPMSQENAVGLLGNVKTPLLKWYDEYARVLPWRSNPTPYWVWLSEIMLQQTRVEAVLPYFKRFIEALPDIPSLAHASEEQLHKLWEGLGYYSRVRNLHKAALQVMERYDGKLPPSYELLLDLCGIGEYTAGAIASIAFGEPVPAVDGNVLRVFSRVLGCESDIASLQVKKAYRELLLAAMPQDRPGDFNQAVMDLGAGICLPNGVPLCSSCPLAHLCMAFREGTQMVLPVKSAKKARRVEEKTVFLICSPEGVLLHKRPEEGLLAGLWEFPNIPPRLTREQAEELLREQGNGLLKLYTLKEAKHIFTHIEWKMTGYLAVCQKAHWDGAVPATLRELETVYAVPGAFAPFKKQLLEYAEKGMIWGDRTN